MKTGTMKLRVLPVVAIPHVISKKGVDYIFTPDCEEVPVDFGNALIKTNPGVYALAVKELTEEELGEYTYKEKFKNQSLLQLIEKLTDAQKGTVLRVVNE